MSGLWWLGICFGRVLGVFDMRLVLGSVRGFLEIVKEVLFVLIRIKKLCCYRVNLVVYVCVGGKRVLVIMVMVGESDDILIFVGFVLKYLLIFVLVLDVIF